MLCQLDQYSFSYGFLSTCGALVAKGLVERRFTESEGKVVLTESGKAVIPLLRMAGLYVTYPPIPSAVDLPLMAAHFDGSFIFTSTLIGGRSTALGIGG